MRRTSAALNNALTRLTLLTSSPSPSTTMAEARAMNAMISSKRLTCASRIEVHHHHLKHPHKLWRFRSPQAFPCASEHDNVQHSSQKWAKRTKVAQIANHFGHLFFEPWWTPFCPRRVGSAAEELQPVAGEAQVQCCGRQPQVASRRWARLNCGPILAKAWLQVDEMPRELLKMWPNVGLDPDEKSIAKGKDFIVVVLRRVLTAYTNEAWAFEAMRHCVVLGSNFVP